MAIDKKCLIITGMHRSNTSLVANAFHNAGLNLGPDLIGSSRSNVYGHFEERKIVDFHQQQIRDLSLHSWFSIVDYKKAIRLSYDTTAMNNAAELIRQTYHTDQFGWKDPRTPFFIKLWTRTVSDVRFFFVIRHPLLCVQSLLKRRFPNYREVPRPLLAWRYLNLWYNTNLCILDFAKTSPQKCIIAISLDSLENTTEVDRINNRIRGEWGFRLSPVEFESLIDYTQLSLTCDLSYLNYIYHLRRSTRQLFEELCRLKSAQWTR